MTKIAELKKRLMEVREFRAEYRKADTEFAVIEAQVQSQVELPAMPTPCTPEQTHS